MAALCRAPCSLRLSSKKLFSQASIRTRLPRSHPGRRCKSSLFSTSQASQIPSKAPLTPVEVPTQIKEAAPEALDIPAPLWYHRLGPVSNFFRSFNRVQQRRPLTVQFCTSLTVYLCGDLLAQEIGGERYDPKRTMRMLAIGAISSIPGYKWLLPFVSQGLARICVC